MRGFHLNGWQRIGIALSVGWVLWGGYDGLISNSSRAVLTNKSAYETCYFFETAQKTYDIQKCEAQAETAEKEVRAQAWDEVLSGGTIALVSVLVAWLIAYALVAIVRWTRHGFKPST